MFFLISSYN